MFKKFFKYLILTVIVSAFWVFLFINVTNYPSYIVGPLLFLILISTLLSGEMRIFDKSKVISYDTAKYYLFEKGLNLEGYVVNKVNFEKSLEKVKENYIYILKDKTVRVIEKDKFYKQIQREKNMVYGFIVILSLISVINFLIGIL